MGIFVAKLNEASSSIVGNSIRTSAGSGASSLGEPPEKEVQRTNNQESLQAKSAPLIIGKYDLSTILSDASVLQDTIGKRTAREKLIANLDSSYTHTDTEVGEFTATPISTIVRDAELLAVLLSRPSTTEAFIKHLGDTLPSSKMTVAHLLAQLPKSLELVLANQDTKAALIKLSDLSFSQVCELDDGSIGEKEITVWDSLRLKPELSDLLDTYKFRVGVNEL